MCKLLAGNINYLDNLSLLPFFPPSRSTGFKNIFRLSLEVANYAINALCNRIMKSVNKFEIGMFILPNFYTFKICDIFIVRNS